MGYLTKDLAIKTQDDLWLRWGFNRDVALLGQVWVNKPDISTRVNLEQETDGVVRWNSLKWSILMELSQVVPLTQTTRTESDKEYCSESSIRIQSLSFTDVLYSCL